MHWSLDDEREFLASLSTDNYEDDRGCSEQENATEVLSSFRQFIDTTRKQARLRDEFYEACIHILTHGSDNVHGIGSIIYALKDGLDPNIALDTVTRADYHILAGKDQ